MKKFMLCLTLLLSCSLAVDAQLSKKFKKAVNPDNIKNAVGKATQALTLSDAELSAYVQEYIDWSDQANVVCTINDKDPKSKAYAQRLDKILFSAPDVKELRLDVKAYYTTDVNAFACANGSIRIFSGLMDRMTDDQILGVIGHEVGHIVNRDTKGSFQKALLTSALKDVIASTGSVAQALTDSQLGALGENLASAQFSQKQEYAADEYGYNFLARSGRDPQAMATSLRVIESLQGEYAQNSGAMKQLFSSHPESAKRAQRLDDIHSKSGGVIHITNNNNSGNKPTVSGKSSTTDDSKVNTNSAKTSSDWTF